MEEKKVKRSKFSSNLGMMLACIGGAVGLGNVWVRGIGYKLAGEAQR